LLTADKPAENEVIPYGNPTHPTIVHRTNNRAHAPNTRAQTQPAQPSEALKMKDLLDYANPVDFVEDEEEFGMPGTDLALPKPSTVHLREKIISRPRTSKPVPLGQTEHCAWFLTKGFTA